MQCFPVSPLFCAIFNSVIIDARMMVDFVKNLVVSSKVLQVFCLAVIILQIKLVVSDSSRS